MGAPSALPEGEREVEPRDRDGGPLHEHEPRVHAQPLADEADRAGEEEALTEEPVLGHERDPLRDPPVAGDRDDEVADLAGAAAGDEGWAGRNADVQVG